MVLALAQVTDSTSDYDSATIALFVVFIISLTVTAGLLLRDLMFPDSDEGDRPGGRPWPDEEPAERLLPPDALPPQTDAWRPPVSGARLRDAEASTPAWFSQAMTSQRAEAVVGITATIEKLLDASNRGDLKAGFSCYTPEHLARYQREHESDVGSLERLSRMQPVEAEQRISVRAVRDIVIDPPHRAFATVDYQIEDGTQPPSERLHFHFDQSAGAWLIEEIEGVEG
jgi:hypothetical protein